MAFMCDSNIPPLVMSVTVTAIFLRFGHLKIAAIACYSSAPNNAEGMVKSSDPDQIVSIWVYRRRDKVRI